MMARSLFHVAALLLVLPASPSSTPDYPTWKDAPSRPVEVTGVVDANTILIKAAPDAREERVDLLGVRVPGTREQQQAVVDALSRWLVGETALLVTDPAVGDSRGAFHVLRLPDRMPVNLELIRQGYTRLDTHPPFDASATFSTYQDRARQRKIGVWSDSTVRTAEPPVAEPAGDAPQPAAGDVIVYVTKSGSKYHRADCRHARASGQPVALSQAPAGLGPCGTCKPPAR